MYQMGHLLFLAKRGADHIGCTGGFSCYEAYGNFFEWSTSLHQTDPQAKQRWEHGYPAGMCKVDGNETYAEVQCKWVVQTYSGSYGVPLCIPKAVVSVALIFRENVCPNVNTHK